MKIVIEFTDEIRTVRGVRCRKWLGVTDDGEACHVFVALVAVPDSSDSTAFDAHLLRAGETQYPPLDAVAGMAALYKAGGHGWDDVADPEKLIRESRGD